MWYNLQMTFNTVGRPNLSGNSGEQSPVLTLRLPKRMFKAVEEEAAVQKVHRNQIVRAALDAYLQGRTEAVEDLTNYDIVERAKQARRERLAAGKEQES